MVLSPPPPPPPPPPPQQLPPLPSPPPQPHHVAEANVGENRIIIQLKSPPKSPKKRKKKVWKPESATVRELRKCYMFHKAIDIYHGIGQISWVIQYLMDIIEDKSKMVGLKILATRGGLVVDKTFAPMARKMNIMTMRYLNLSWICDLIEKACTCIFQTSFRFWPPILVTRWVIDWNLGAYSIILALLKDLYPWTEPGPIESIPKDGRPTKKKRKVRERESRNAEGMQQVQDIIQHVEDDPKEENVHQVRQVDLLQVLHGVNQDGIQVIGDDQSNEAQREIPHDSMHEQGALQEVQENVHQEAQEGSQEAVQGVEHEPGEQMPGLRNKEHLGEKKDVQENVEHDVQGNEGQNIARDKEIVQRFVEQSGEDSVQDNVKQTGEDKVQVNVEQNRHENARGNMEEDDPIILEENVQPEDEQQDALGMNENEEDAVEADRMKADEGVAEDEEDEEEEEDDDDEDSFQEDLKWESNLEVVMGEHSFLGWVLKAMITGAKIIVRLILGIIIPILSYLTLGLCRLSNILNRCSGLYELETFIEKKNRLDLFARLVGTKTILDQGQEMEPLRPTEWLFDLFVDRQVGCLMSYYGLHSMFKIVGISRPVVIAERLADRLKQFIYRKAELVRYLREERNYEEETDPDYKPNYDEVSVDSLEYVDDDDLVISSETDNDVLPTPEKIVDDPQACNASKKQGSPYGEISIQVNKSLLPEEVQDPLSPLSPDEYRRMRSKNPIDEAVRRMENSSEDDEAAWEGVFVPILVPKPPKRRCKKSKSKKKNKPKVDKENEGHSIEGKPEEESSSLQEECKSSEASVAVIHVKSQGTEQNVGMESAVDIPVILIPNSMKPLNDLTKAEELGSRGLEREASSHDPKVETIRPDADLEETSGGVIGLAVSITPPQSRSPNHSTDVDDQTKHEKSPIRDFCGNPGAECRSALENDKDRLSSNVDTGHSANGW